MIILRRNNKSFSTTEENNEGGGISTGMALGALGAGALGANIGANLGCTYGMKKGFLDTAKKVGYTYKPDLDFVKSAKPSISKAITTNSFGLYKGLGQDIKSIQGANPALSKVSPGLGGLKGARTGMIKGGLGGAALGIGGALALGSLFNKKKDK